MAGKRHTPEQIVRKLREAEVELSKGQPIKAVCKKLQITDQTYYRWRKEYGGLQVSQARRLNSEDVLECLASLFVYRGVPCHIRSDNGPEFTAKAVRDWLGRVGVQTLFIEPGPPWENGYIESFHGKLRDELLNGEIFYTLKEARVAIDSWRRHCNEVRPHSSLGYRAPRPWARLLRGPGSATLRRDREPLGEKIAT